MLAVAPIRTAWTLHTNDQQLKGTALEYLETVTPPDTRRLLRQVLEADDEYRASTLSSNEALADLLDSQAQINQSLGPIVVARA